MMWTALDTWIVVAAVLAGATCALVGSFLVLKKVSMMGDAISHAVLPGIAVAFIITGSRSGPAMLVGAAVVGVLTAVLVHVIHYYSRLEEGASMGVVFTVLFAIGLILIEQAARHVDIHPEHVLFGAVELVPLHVVSVFGFDIPRGVVLLAIVLLINLSVVTLLFKELRLATFDPELATTLGINATVIHYLLMVLVAMTTVAAFEVVGSILVIAMLIVPGATAWLLTRRLLPFLIVSVAVSILAAILGHIAAITVPPLFGYVDTSTAGSMATVLGILFFGALLFAPEQGVVARATDALRLRLSIGSQDALGLLARAAENTESRDGSLSAAEFRGVHRSPFAGHRLKLAAILALLRVKGSIVFRGGRYHTTRRGSEQGREILRSHRLWEQFFFDDGNVDMSELHPAADVLEHYTNSDLREDLSERFAGKRTDPQGRPIPEED
ncbi:MAG: iron ABC transporter [Spirochaetaceae bacterium]|nr:MAG: iron ABC transporter [Spirochaetaceae bacterium]